MRLSAESHREVEEFFRRYTGRPSLSLPRVRVYAGAWAWLLTRVAGAGAITLGRGVFIRRDFVERDSYGRARVDAELFVHEAAHVLQYEEGRASFLARYLLGYARGLVAGKSLGRRARGAAYLAIPEERAAREAERAFAEWRFRRRGGV
jgi:Domain of unknown function (DUF4157)